MIEKEAAVQTKFLQWKFAASQIRVGALVILITIFDF